MQLKISILKDQISCWTQKILKKEKKANIQVKKNSFFHLVLLSVTNIKKHFIWVHPVFWHLFVPIIRYKIVSVRVRKSSENVFEKSYLFVGKNDFGLFLLYSFHQDCLQPVTSLCFAKHPRKSVQSLGSFLYHVSRCWKHKLQENGQNSSEQNHLAYFYCYHLVGQNFEKIFSNFTRYSAGKCVSSNIISVTPN